MKFLLSLCAALICTQSVWAQVIDIATARTRNIGDVVTVRGVVLNGDELGGSRYLQDATGGIGTFPGSGSQANFTTTAVRGVEVEVTGPLADYNGLLQISPVTAYTVVNASATLPAPLVTDATGVNEQNESTLIRVEDATFAAGGGTFSSTTYDFTDANGNSSKIYLRSGHPLIGQTIPLTTVDIIGVSSEFRSHQLLPRDNNDLVITNTFFISSGTAQQNITNSSFDLSWEVTSTANSVPHVRYGLTESYELGAVNGTAAAAGTQTVALTGLDAAEFYYAQPYSVIGTDTAWGSAGLYATASNSTGDIQVYFNQTIDTTLAVNGQKPGAVSGARMEQVVIELINSAKTSIEMFGYNINRNDIVHALNNAHDRGVAVRYIHDAGTSNLAFGAVGTKFPRHSGVGSNPGLMHNKAIIVDAESTMDAKLLMGSMNFTSNNIFDDPNNVVIFQDEALAKAYRMEFNEMWGATSGPAGVFASLFGDRKENNTPHHFNVGGLLVENYFSPSDQTSSAIEAAISTADTDLNISMLVFTYNALGAKVEDLQRNGGVNVRVILDDTSGQGTEYPNLVSAGVSVIRDRSTDQHHHKYAIVDATNPASDPMVITGSHNWSANAETRSDENTVIIHDATIANYFLQEFQARWCTANGGSDCGTLVSTTRVAAFEGFEATLLGNPVTDAVRVQLDAAKNTNVAVSLFSLQGQRLEARFVNNLQGRRVLSFSTASLPAGMYVLAFEIDGEVMAKQFVVK